LTSKQLTLGRFGQLGALSRLTLRQFDTGFRVILHFCTKNYHLHQTLASIRKPPWNLKVKLPVSHLKTIFQFHVLGFYGSFTKFTTIQEIHSPPKPGGFPFPSSEFVGHLLILES
jgi:hypothetical protein